MRFVPTRVHGMLDYLIGVLLIAAPWLLDFADGGAEQWIPVALGAGLILYSLLTDYELSLVDAIPMPVHLALDFGAGLFLAVSPWLFGFADEVWAPHVVVGVVDMLAALTTETVRDDERERAPLRARDRAPRVGD